MDSQTAVAAIIIILALTYAGSLVYKKLGAFSPKSSDCGADCGCSNTKGSAINQSPTSRGSKN